MNKATKNAETKRSRNGKKQGSIRKERMEVGKQASHKEREDERKKRARKKQSKHPERKIP